MAKKIDYHELVRLAFARLGYVNHDDIDMHEALWMYKIPTADLCLDLMHSITEIGKFKEMHLIQDIFLDEVLTMDASLDYIAKKLPEYLDKRPNIKTEIVQGVLAAEEEAKKKYKDMKHIQRKTTSKVLNENTQQL